MLHAVLNMLMGMGSVFLVLVLICLCIYCFQIFPYLEKRKKERQAQKTDNAEVTTRLASDTQTETIPVQDDQEVVAAIMAAITAYTGLSQDDFVVRSIVRR